jgi:hypothetical protein
VKRPFTAQGLVVEDSRHFIFLSKEDRKCIQKKAFYQVAVWGYERNTDED